MGYPDAARERAMTVQEVMLKALSGEIHWFRAADILGMHPRSLRRWRERYEAHGYDGLIDKRYQRPSQRRVPMADVERVLRLYREPARSRGWAFEPLVREGRVPVALWRDVLDHHVHARERQHQWCLAHNLLGHLQRSAREYSRSIPGRLARGRLLRTPLKPAPTSMR